MVFGVDSELVAQFAALLLVVALILEETAWCEDEALMQGVLGDLIEALKGIRELVAPEVDANPAASGADAGAVAAWVASGASASDDPDAAGFVAEHRAASYLDRELHLLELLHRCEKGPQLRISLREEADTLRFDSEQLQSGCMIA